MVPFRFVSLQRVIAFAAVALSVTACCAGNGAEPVDAARNDASSELSCPSSALSAQPEWQSSSCDGDGYCNDEVWVHVTGCGRSAVYSCTPCWGSYDCTRVD